jgi:hypothetical protein
MTFVEHAEFSLIAKLKVWYRRRLKSMLMGSVVYETYSD